MALGDLEVKGKLKVVGTTEMTGSIDLNGGALDTALVTNLNADLMDSAHKDTDGTLSGNSDSSIPTEKAVKTYADARKAECVALTGDQTVAGIKTLSSIPVLPASDPTTDNQAVRKAYVDGASVVHRTGAETIAGVKTFSDVPLLPANTVEEADINNYAVTGQKLGTTFQDNSQSIPAGSDFTPGAAVYTIAGEINLVLQVLFSGTWYSTSASGMTWSGGTVWCDGANMRFHNFDTVSHTLRFKALI